MDRVSDRSKFVSFDSEEVAQKARTEMDGKASPSFLSSPYLTLSRVEIIGYYCIAYAGTQWTHYFCGLCQAESWFQ